MADGSHNNIAELVLIAFEDACPNATDDDVRDWSRRYPGYADKIAAFADVMRRSAAMDDSANEVPLSTEDRSRTKAAAKAFADSRRAEHAEVLRAARKDQKLARLKAMPPRRDREM